MKKALFLKLFLLIFLSFETFSMEINSFNQYKNPYIVFNLSNQSIVKGNKINNKVYPASLTKILTCLIFVENNDLSVPEYKDEFYKTLYKSDNESSEKIAYYTTGSFDSFINLMNNKSKKYGIENTSFTNTSGLFDKKHYTTANDFAIICLMAYKNNEFMNLFKVLKYTNSKNESISYSAGNKMLKHGYKEYDERAFAGKNGYTNESEHNLLTFAHINDDDYAIIVFHENESNCYKITKELMNFVSEKNVDIKYKKENSSIEIKKYDQNTVSPLYSGMEIGIIFFIFMASFLCLNYYLYNYYKYKKID